MTRPYFTEEAARNLIGRRVEPRVTVIRIGLPSSKTSDCFDGWPVKRFTLIVTAGCRGTVTQFASGPFPDSYLVGVAWDDSRPLIPRRNRYPIDWYTEDEYRSLLGVPVEKAA